MAQSDVLGADHLHSLALQELQANGPRRMVSALLANLRCPLAPHLFGDVS
jgi:hypothetical protein